MLSRIWNGAIAVLAVAALALQLWIALRLPGTPPSPEVGRLAGATLTGRLLRMASFFTIQSNVLSAITAAQLARDPDRDGPIWRVVRLDALLGITVTGVVYSTVLARIHEPKGWQQVSSNAAVHYVVPIMMLLGWLRRCANSRLPAGVAERTSRGARAGRGQWIVLVGRPHAASGVEHDRDRRAARLGRQGANDVR